MIKIIKKPPCGVIKTSEKYFIFTVIKTVVYEVFFLCPDFYFWNFC